MFALCCIALDIVVVIVLVLLMLPLAIHHNSPPHLKGPICHGEFNIFI